MVLYHLYLLHMLWSVLAGVLGLAAVVLATAVVTPPRTARSIPVVRPPAIANHSDSISTRTAVVVEVHPGVELLAIMAYLGKRYPTPPDSRYKTAVWAHFAPYRNHPALDSVRSAPLFPDFTELGLTLRGFPNPTVTLPDSSSWYETHGRERVQTILRQAIRFAKDSRFAEFRRRHAAEYASWVGPVRSALRENGRLDEVARFYRYAGDREALAELRVYLDPLNNWGAHYMDMPLAFGIPSDRVIRFQIGPDGDARHPDSRLGFAMGDFELAIVWHEMGHYFVRPFMREHADRIARLAPLFEASREALKRQNISTWSYAFEESLVRSVVAALIHQQRGTEAMEKEVTIQSGMGFALVADLSELIVREYLPNRARYPDFTAFGGRVLETLEARRP